MYKSIKKRDGRVVKFNPEKIAEAITKAANATDEFGEKEAKKLAEKVLERAQKEIPEKILLPIDIVNSENADYYID